MRSILRRVVTLRTINTCCTSTAIANNRAGYRSVATAGTPSSSSAARLRGASSIASSYKSLFSLRYLVPSLLAVSLAFPNMATIATAASSSSAATIETKSAASSTTPARLLKTAAIMPPRAGDTHRFTIIWMHGLGDSSDGFTDLFDQIQPKDTKIILPNAPVRAVTINGGSRMQSWYDIISTKRTADLNYPEDNAGIAEATALVLELIDDEAKKIGSHNIIIGGFSQGSAMSLHTSMRYTQKLGGVVACSGYLMLAKEYPAAINAANRDTPILMYHGSADTMVALDRAQASYNILKNAGVNIELTVEPKLGHSLSAKQVKLIVAYFAKQQSAAAAITAAATSTATTAASPAVAPAPSAATKEL